MASALSALLNALSPVSKVSRPRFRPNLLCLEQRIVPAEYLWNGQNDGAIWSVPANWLVNKVVPATPPGPNDSVILNAAANTDSVVDAAFQGTIRSLDKAVGHTKDLILNRPLNVTLEANQRAGWVVGGQLNMMPQGTYTWHGGGMTNGTLQIAPGSFVSITSTGDKHLRNHSLNVNGTASWFTDGKLLLEESAKVSVNGVFEVTQQTMNVVHDFTPTRFEILSNGVFKVQKSVTMDAYFEMRGRTDVTIAAGEPGLTLKRNSLSTGTYRLLAADSQLTLGHAPADPPLAHDFLGATVTGPGYLYLGFPNALMNVLGGTTNVDRMRQVPATTLGGPGTLNVTDKFEWSGGTWSGSSVTQIAPNKLLDILGNDAAYVIDQRTLGNRGTTHWHGASDVELKNGGKVVNQQGGLFKFLSAQRLRDGGSGGGFTNYGEASKDSAGTTSVEVPFVNEQGGILRAPFGKLKVVGQLDNSGSIYPANPGIEVVGTFTQSALGVLYVADAGRFKVSGEAYQSGGTVQVINGGQLTVDGPYVYLVERSR